MSLVGLCVSVLRARIRGLLARFHMVLLLHKKLCLVRELIKVYPSVDRNALLGGSPVINYCLRFAAREREMKGQSHGQRAIFLG